MREDPRSFAVGRIPRPTKLSRLIPIFSMFSGLVRARDDRPGRGRVRRAKGRGGAAIMEGDRLLLIIAFSAEKCEHFPVGLSRTARRPNKMNGQLKTARDMLTIPEQLRFVFSRTDDTTAIGTCCIIIIPLCPDT